MTSSGWRVFSPPACQLPVATRHSVRMALLLPIFDKALGEVGKTGLLADDQAAPGAPAC